MSAAPKPFGPWAPDIDDAERVLRFRSVATLAVLLNDRRLCNWCLAAESNIAAASTAWRAMLDVPPIARDRLIDAYHSVAALATEHRQPAHPPGDPTQPLQRRSR